MISRILIVFISVVLFSCGNSTNNQQTDSAIANTEPASTETKVALKEEVADDDTKTVVQAKTNSNTTEQTKTSFNGADKTSTPTTSTKSEKPIGKPIPSKDKDAVVIDVKSMPAPTATVESRPTTPKAKPTTIKDKPKAVKKPVVKATFSHATFDKFLNDNINGKTVDYKGMMGDRLMLKKYLESLKNNPIQKDWRRSKKMAYWINAYNAFTIKLILDNYPISSITKLDNGKPWDRKWIKLGGKTLSLNDIENNILRPQFNDPRIHFAVNCAAKSCPPIWNHAWTASNLNSTLDKRAKSFINGKLNVISADNIKISKIFDWYKKDFGNLIQFLNKYTTTKINAGAKIDYVEYDWSLNGI